MQFSLSECEINDSSVSAPNGPYLPFVFLLDTSASMGGELMDSLNSGLRAFFESVAEDDYLNECLDIAVVTFDETARVVQPFTSPSQVPPMSLSAGMGGSSMGEGIKLAVQLLKDRRHFYNDLGIPHYKPWIFMITDGLPTDDISEARQLIAEEESRGKYGQLKFWAVGVPGCSREVITSLTNRCIELENVSFEGIFHWLSEIMYPNPACMNINLPDLPPEAKVIPVEW